MDRMTAMEAFVRVVDAGSFSAAARQLRLGQPAVSKAIAQLEKRLGMRLSKPMNTLFSPAKVGPYELSHRVVMAPLTRMRSEPGDVPGDLMVEYYSQRASRGGLIVAEAMPRTGWIDTTDADHLHDTNPAMERAEYIDAIKRDVQWLGFDCQATSSITSSLPLNVIASPARLPSNST
jgi:hypothetical protein